jgi:transposase
VVSEDESFVVRDAIVTRVWAPEGKRPICRVTGSHERTVVFGAMDMEGRKIFRQYDTFDGENFLDFLKQIHKKYGRLYLFLDKAKQHYKTKIVREYMRKNRATLRVRWIPVGSPAFNVMEECWRQMDNDLLALRFYSSLNKLERAVGGYLRKKKFRLNMVSFLLTNRYG